MTQNARTVALRHRKRKCRSQDARRKQESRKWEDWQSKFTWCNDISDEFANSKGKSQTFEENSFVLLVLKVALRRRMESRDLAFS